MFSGRVYSCSARAMSISGAGCLMLFTAADDKPIILLSAIVTQETSESSEQLPVAIYRTSTAGTPAGSLATGTDINPVNPNDPAASFTATKGAFSVQPTKAPTDPVAFSEAQNALNGWRYVPVPEERIVCVQANAIGIFLEAAPSVVTPLSLRLLVNVLEL